MCCCFLFSRGPILSLVASVVHAYYQLWVLQMWCKIHLWHLKNKEPCTEPQCQNITKDHYAARLLEVVGRQEGGGTGWGREDWVQERAEMAATSTAYPMLPCGQRAQQGLLDSVLAQWWRRPITTNTPLPSGHSSSCFSVLWIQGHHFEVTVHQDTIGVAVKWHWLVFYW